MMSGSEASMFNLTDGSVTVAAVAILQTLGDLLAAPLAETADTYQLVLPAAGANPIIDISAAVGRVTPSAIKSRRVSQYLIG
jgi:hypothetical protein